MPWHFRSMLYDVTEAEVDWAEMGRRRYWTRRVIAGWIEVALFVVVGVTEVCLLLDFVRHRAPLSGYLGGLLVVLTFWPFLRHRIREGEWPN